jgi:hypothetical protein
MGGKKLTIRSGALLIHPPHDHSVALGFLNPCPQPTKQENNATDHTITVWKQAVLPFRQGSRLRITTATH